MNENNYDVQSLEHSDREEGLNVRMSEEQSVLIDSDKDDLDDWYNCNNCGNWHPKGSGCPRD